VPTLAVVATNNSVGTTQSIAVRYPFAYLGQGTNFIVMDISDPAAPKVGGPLPLVYPVEDIVVSPLGNYAYIAAEQAGIQIIDISEATNPTIKGSDTAPTPAFGIAYADSVSIAYLAQSSGGFRLVNVLDPAAPSGLSSYPMTSANKVAVSGDYAYIANGSGGLMVMNVATPIGGWVAPYPTPEMISTYNSPGVAKDVVFDGDYAFLADGTQGLRVVRVSTPTAPTSYGSFIFSGDAQAISLQLYLGTMYAYVAAGASGVWVFDVTNPASPVALKYYDTPGSANDVAVVGDKVYVADGIEGLLILRFP
jgi:hypothetical protein